MSPPEQRAHRREPLNMPVQLPDGSAALTRDISSGGLYVWTARGAHVPHSLLFELRLVPVGLVFRAEGELVRRDHLPHGDGIAIRLLGGSLQRG